MKFGWAGFFGARRLREMERGQADMRETLALLTAQAPLMTELSRTLAALIERVAMLESQSDADRKTLRKMASAAFVSDNQIEFQGEEMARLSAAMLRLEGQLDEQAAEVRKVATGLLERIEQTRPGIAGRTSTSRPIG